jgi:CPA2 family monovalent cation:H+ antiporter-2
MGSALVALGGALVAASVLGRIGRRVGLPTIPLFMLAGLLFGPHTPGFDLVHDPGDLELLATLGLVLLLFSLGLEYSLADLVAGGRRLLVASALCLAVNLGAGLAFGFLLGWGSREAFVIAGVLGISSSAIVTKLLVEFGRLDNHETRVILGIIVLEDLFLAIYLSVLQPLLHGAASGGAVLLSVAGAFAFLAALALIAHRAGHVIHRFVETDDNELLTIGFVGLALLTAGIAEQVGVSEAIGAFMVGLILAKSASRERITRLVLPIRDTFAALFFFAFGVTIDPTEIGSVALPVAAAVALTFVCTVAAGALVARLNGFGLEAAANVAFTILARGDFSPIVAAVAATAGLDHRIGPFTAGYVLVLAVASPLLAAKTGRLARRRPECPGPERDQLTSNAAM